MSKLKEWPHDNKEQSIFEEDRVQNIKIYYAYNVYQGAAQIDKLRTVRAMLWMFQKYNSDPMKALSAYFSIMNALTYPKLKKIAPKLPKLVGIRLCPTPLLMTAVPDGETPLSSVEQLCLLTKVTLLLGGFQDLDKYEECVAEIMASVTVTNSIDTLEITETCLQISTFMSSPLQISLSKYLFDSLVLETNSAKNSKLQSVLQSCLKKMPKLFKCQAILE